MNYDVELLRTLIEVEGLSIAKAAARIGVSVSTLQKRMRVHGIQTLRDSNGRLKRCHEPGVDCLQHPMTVENQRVVSDEQAARIDASVGDGSIRLTD